MEIDDSIIQEAQSGDPCAFERIVERYSRSLYQYVRNVVGDDHRAEDVVQITLINVYRNLDRFDAGRGRLSTWMFRIARNAAINELRRGGRPTPIFETPVEPIDSDRGPQFNAEMREQFALLDQAASKLPANQRSAWVLFELQGLSQAEVAEIEGIPEGTVKSRVSRAKESLRKSLEGKVGLER